MRKHGAGVYVFRARKHRARFHIPFLSWQFAYVGETRSMEHRYQQHMYGLGKWATVPKPWSDLEPYVWLFIPLPRWKWLLRSVETLVIMLTWPVYNHAKNLWNPRRVPIGVQYHQRKRRDARRRQW